MKPEPQVEYPRLVRDRKRTPLGSLKDYEDLLARTKLLPRMVGQVRGPALHCVHPHRPTLP